MPAKLSSSNCFSAVSGAVSGGGGLLGGRGGYSGRGAVSYEQGTHADLLRELSREDQRRIGPSRDLPTLWSSTLSSNPSSICFSAVSGAVSKGFEVWGVGVGVRGLSCGVRGPQMCFHHHFGRDRYAHLHTGAILSPSCLVYYTTHTCPLPSASVLSPSLFRGRGS